jgi:hypothetical protein
VTNETPRQETTGGIQNNTGDSFTGEFIPLWGGLARPFDELLLKSKNIPIEIARDLKGNEISQNEITEYWEKHAIVKFELSLENLRKNEVINTGLPNGLPLGRAIFSTAEPVKYAKTEITIFDGKKTPKLLREEEKGGPIEWDAQEVPNEQPDKEKYEMDFYFRIGTVIDGEEKHPIKEALFELFPQLPDPYAYNRIRVLRWHNDQQKWNELDFKANNCAGSGKDCRVIANSPGTSYFAVVTDKLPLYQNIFIKIFQIGFIAFVGEILALVGLIIAKKRFKKIKKRTIAMLMLITLLVTIIGIVGVISNVRTVY